ncbi:HpcH/HpaI aldolase family protein [Flagellimonas sp.]|uniref:HpcH/HpaI aldolase family protein n=1 Tax=Flagellimonas sp. TaxID=2058762 RepID=UPI003B52E504
MPSLKQRLSNGETLLGTFASLGSSITTEIIGSAAWDWILLDLEHGLGSEKDVLGQLQALSNTPIEVIVRVESSHKERIQKVLDLGAHGVMCPRIETTEQATVAIKAMRYAPLGNRGVAKMIRATSFASKFESYSTNNIKELLGIIQIETVEALDHLDDIAALEGCDVLFIGPSDLSMALGIFGQLDHPKFLKAEETIIEAAKRAGKSVGVFIVDPEDFSKYYLKGIRFFACGTDAFFLKKQNQITAERLSELRDDLKD